VRRQRRHRRRLGREQARHDVATRGVGESAEEPIDVGVGEIETYNHLVVRYGAPAIRARVSDGAERETGDARAAGRGAPLPSLAPTDEDEAMTSIPPGFERVHSVTHYRDAPREGVADYGGVPHVFRSVFRAERDAWDDDRYFLKPIGVEEAALVREDWEIFERFAMRYRDEVAPTPDDPADYGALPEDLARFRELRRLLVPIFTLEPQACLVAHGEFRARFDASATPDADGSFEPVLDVRWRAGRPLPGDVLLPSPVG
jgi:hypothetical protein